MECPVCRVLMRPGQLENFLQLNYCQLCGRRIYRDTRIAGHPKEDAHNDEVM